MKRKLIVQYNKSNVKVYQNLQFLVFSGGRTTARSYLRGPSYKTKSNIAKSI